MITELIKETVVQDSLEKESFISNKLLNYYIYHPEKDSETGLFYALPKRNGNENPFIMEFVRKDLKKNIGYYLTIEDSIFIVEQVYKNKNILLDSINFNEELNVSSITSKVAKEKHKRLYVFAIPIFNHAETIVWVGYDCYCSECGYGRVVIFRKINNRWLKSFSFDTWIS
jgi:hypothetical protein